MAPLNIKRRDGETEADFQRRYCREKMRIYRAGKPKSDRKRGKAKGPKADGTLTLEEWRVLQQRPDESDEDWTKRYARDRMRMWRGKNPARVRESAKRWYYEHPETEKARRIHYRAENPDKVKATQAVYYRQHKGKRDAALKAWAVANPERYAEVRQRWYDENRALRNAYSAAWRRACREQTPPWADFKQMKVFYEEAVRLTEATGVPHHVDHIIPLRGRNVRGLHVQTNLRVITATENVRKQNRLIEDLAA
jgi:hypothetical protein